MILIYTLLKMKKKVQLLNVGIELLKIKMWKQFTKQSSTHYLDILPDILNKYNNNYHRSIKMTPVEASKKKNEGIVYFNLYGDITHVQTKAKFNVGDTVRISKYKRKLFDKGYTPNWTEEIFLISKVLNTKPTHLRNY